jgi:hypothetical protein
MAQKENAEAAAAARSDFIASKSEFRFMSFSQSGVGRRISVETELFLIRPMLLVLQKIRG